MWDCDGNEYIDFRCALGPVTLGYQTPQVNEAIVEQLRRGISFGQPTRLEFELAEKLVQVIPCAEAVRYLKTGGEAMAAAIRLARAATGRSVILTCGYHGWINATAGAGQLPALRENQWAFDYGDEPGLAALFEQHRGKVAAVTLAGAYGVMRLGDSFPQQLRQLAEENGSLLIVDEIVTGFRLALGGWHDYYQTSADLAVFSKGIANGMPLSVLTGRADLLSQSASEAVVSSTFSGESLSIAAALAVLDVYRGQGVIEHLWKTGKIFMDACNVLFQEHGIPASFRGLPPCPALIFDPPEGSKDAQRWQRALFRALYRHGVSMYLVAYVNFSHKAADIEEALRRIAAACPEVDPEREEVADTNLPRIGAQANLGVQR